MAAEAARNGPKVDSEAGSADAKADPSMEEILQSIRRIIAEDDQPGEKENADAFGSDVLELTEMVQDDGSSLPAGNTAINEMPPDVLASIDNALEPSSMISNSPSPASPMGDAEASANALLSDTAAAASANAFRKLAQSREKPAAAPIASPAFRSGATVEDLVQEALRPMLKAWLDANLHGIVERVVEREVKRLSGQ
ncbi:MAG: DUF2497 domain-containing protein [Alphaproteobacteria bacterium]|nr:DUF2497 domain-containing protein [Alphaproteobacteria bacterium]